LKENPAYPSRGKAGASNSVLEIARELGISKATFHRWKARYGGMSSQEAKRLKELEKENARLKKLLAEEDLDIDMLKEASQGNV
jgi:putative transposase